VAAPRLDRSAAEDRPYYGPRGGGEPICGPSSKTRVGAFGRRRRCRRRHRRSIRRRPRHRHPSAVVKGDRREARPRQRYRPCRRFRRAGPPSPGRPHARRDRHRRRGGRRCRRRPPPRPAAGGPLRASRRVGVSHPFAPRPPRLSRHPVRPVSVGLSVAAARPSREQAGGRASVVARRSSVVSS